MFVVQGLDLSRCYDLKRECDGYENQWTDESNREDVCQQARQEGVAGG